MDFAPNTNVIGHAGRTFAIVEAGARPYELNNELETIGPCDFGGTLEGGYTAHPKRDPLTGELYAVSYFFGWGNDVEVTIIDTQAQGALEPARRHGRPVSLHDCAITQRSIVLLDLPVTFSLDAAAAGASFPYRWEEGYRSRVGLLPRDGDSTDVVWHDVEPCYVFHPMNAFDDPEATASCSTWCATPPCSAPTSSALPKGRRRWSAGTSTATAARSRRSGSTTAGRSSRGSTSGASACPTATATPCRSASRTTSSGRSRCCCATISSRGRARPAPSAAGRRLGEAVFVPREDGAGESDGWLLLLVHSADTDTSALHILNADDLAGEAQAVIELPQRVPAGFHGNWVPDSPA